MDDLQQRIELLEKEVELLKLKVELEQQKTQDNYQLYNVHQMPESQSSLWHNLFGFDWYL